jgi:hypothetical protein
MLGLVSIVEGKGEKQALPIVLRRVLKEMSPPHVFDILTPIHRPRDKMLKPGELERAVDLASRQIARRGAILVVLDSDDDQPCELGPRLLQRAQNAASEIPTRVVLAHREWEAWYRAAAASLAGRRGLLPNLTPPNNPEAGRDAKGWLTKHMTPGRAYSPTVDQPAFAAIFDLDAARQAPSFSKLCRDIRYLRDETLQKFPFQ